MSEIPPQQFAAYPRAESLVNPEAADKLQALFSGYSVLSFVFIMNIAFAFVESYCVQSGNLNLGLGAVVGMVVIIAASTYPSNKKIGYGLGWSPSASIVASILMGINSAFCCGIIGYLVMQSLAAKGIAKAGVRRRWHGGFTKKDVRARIAELRGG